MKTLIVTLTTTLILSLTQTSSIAQAAQQTAPPSLSIEHTNTAIIPVERTDERGRKRTEEVLKRAKENPGKYDIAFIGDSITQKWETDGKSVWEKYYGRCKAINLGVGGDRTQHVLWRFEQGQLKGLQPKVSVVMIGTNNSNRDDNKESDILQGVTEIVRQIQEQLPNTKVLLLGIFPRGSTFSTQRGKILQVNQALSKLADNKKVFYMDFGAKLIEDDGSISKEIMRDYLHLSDKGYEIWAESIAPELKKLGV